MKAFCAVLFLFFLFLSLAALTLPLYYHHTFMIYMVQLKGIGVL